MRDQTAPGATELDTAVALLELGGYTHIFARAALAVIDAAGCLRAVALIATGASGPRLIEYRGWDESAALAAAHNPGPCDVLPLGDYRDETWQLTRTSSRARRWPSLRRPDVHGRSR